MLQPVLFLSTDHNSFYSVRSWGSVDSVSSCYGWDSASSLPLPRDGDRSTEQWIRNRIRLSTGKCLQQHDQYYSINRTMMIAAIISYLKVTY